MAGEIKIVFEDDGEVKFDISGKVNYMMIYGAAAVLNETARIEQAKSAMAGMAQGLQVARGIPGMPKES